MMAPMTYSLKNTEPYQIGFKQAVLYLTRQLSLLPAVAPGRIPRVMKEIMPMAERVNGILKNELLITRPAGIIQAGRMVAESVKIYNGQWPHLSLKYKPPDAVHQAV